ncbi:MAG: hypothetical protein PHC64_06070 [Candidatus Gastranaerophilales bacterium]|nr:hypothetical protein [Candidatus Gastranaerophilales bacterium]
MSIEGFDYQSFAQELSAQANELLPAHFQDFQKQYVINTIKNFATLCGEAVSNDEKLHFSAEQGMLITQIIAEWSFHKSVDVIKAGILPDYWDGIMQKIAFTIFEIAKQTISQNLSQEEILQIVEHHVKKSYEQVLSELKERKIIDNAIYERAIHQSNIDDMMQQLQQEKTEIEQQTQQAQLQEADYSNNSKILKLASVAILLKQIPQDKVKVILEKINSQDAQAVSEYMQMVDLETKIDQSIAIKCLNEIKENLPEPKFINPDKIVTKINSVFDKAPKSNIEKIFLKERPNVKALIDKALSGDVSQVPPKVANIIAQYLEEKST